MKITPEKREANKKKVVQAAVDLVTEKGYKASTMREIARRAGIGEATIYNYFPTKETILFGYYETRFKDCVRELKALEDFNHFSFEEQIQTFYETMLTLFLPDREFVELSFKSIFFSLAPNFRHFRPVQEQFFEILDEIFSAAVEAEEIPDQMFRDMIYYFFWDFFIGMVFYWLRDDSKQFADTSILLDKSLGLAGGAIRAGLLNKAVDIASFLFKNHVLSRMDFFRAHARELKKAKRQFMAAADPS